jgi:hypothetical protein
MTLPVGDFARWLGARASSSDRKIGPHETAAIARPTLFGSVADQSASGIPCRPVFAGRGTVTFRSLTTINAGCRQTCFDFSTVGKYLAEAAGPDGAASPFKPRGELKWPIPQRNSPSRAKANR